jgi:hypothetical protein
MRLDPAIVAGERARRVAIRAGWIVALRRPGHRLLRDGVVVVEGERIVHVGRTIRRAR